MAELVDAHDSKSCIEICQGSSPWASTIIMFKMQLIRLLINTRLYLRFLSEVFFSIVFKIQYNFFIEKGAFMNTYDRLLTNKDYLTLVKKMKTLSLLLMENGIGSMA